jgi:hypothetical protein
MKNSLTGCPVKTLLLLALVIITIMVSSQAFGEGWSAAQKEIWEIQKDEWMLWMKGDREGRLALYHKECIVWLYNTAFPGDKTLIIRGMIKYPKIDSFELEPLEVKVFGNVAIVQYSLKYTAFVKDYNERATNTWMKQDEKWQIIGSMRAQQPTEFPK